MDYWLDEMDDTHTVRLEYKKRMKILDAESNPENSNVAKQNARKHIIDVFGYSFLYAQKLTAWYELESTIASVGISEWESMSLMEQGRYMARRSLSNMLSVIERDESQKQSNLAAERAKSKNK